MSGQGEAPASGDGRNGAKKKPGVKKEAAEPLQERPKNIKLTQEQREVANYVKVATKNNVWYYRDRVSVPRGPCTLPVLRECWVNGVIDENTLVWGHGLADWLPVKNVRTLVPQIRTLEVQMATWVKKNFALKPAIARMRKMRPEHRQEQVPQVDNMR